MFEINILHLIPKPCFVTLLFACGKNVPPNLGVNVLSINLSTWQIPWSKVNDFERVWRESRHHSYD